LGQEPNAGALDPQTNDHGVIVDGWGGVQPFILDGGTSAPEEITGPYWPNWDIARGVALAPDGASGYVLDGWGGLHPFALEGGTLPPPLTTGPYWPNWDIARGVTLLPDGTGGYITDGWGGQHPFGIGGDAAPPAPGAGPYWPGWDIVRGTTIFDVPAPAAAALGAQPFGTEPRTGARTRAFTPLAPRGR
jgi:hypothetical protein